MVTIKTWYELYDYLNSLTGDDLDIEIELDMSQEEASLDKVSEIIFPENVKYCLLSSSNNNIFYKSCITTERTSYFELTIKNLYLKLYYNEFNNIIDIASNEYTNSKTIKNYNVLNFDGVNKISNSTYGCSIHIGKEHGLYINLMYGSETQIESNASSYSGSRIGSERDEDTGDIFILGAGNLNINTYSSTGIGGAYGYWNGSRSGNINISGSVNIYIKTNTGTAIGGGCSDRTGGFCENVVISDKANITIKSIYGTAIGGGFGVYYGGACSNICINGNSSITINTDSGTALGGGHGITSGGPSNKISIYGNSSLNIFTGSGTGIGGGSALVGGGNKGTINIYENAYVKITAGSGTGIGGGCSAPYVSSQIAPHYIERTGGGNQNINIYGNSNLSVVSQFGTGIGGGGITNEYHFYYSGGNCGTIRIYENSNVRVESHMGVAIGSGKSNTSSTFLSGNIEISTSGFVNIISALNYSYALAVSLESNGKIKISDSTPINIIGRIYGGNIEIINQNLIVDSLIYNDTYNSGTINIENGYIVVKDEKHEHYPTDRGDYYIVNLSHNNLPYTSNVLLEKANDNLINSSYSLTQSNEILSNSEITPSTSGNVQIYISDGNYYFASKTNTLIRTPIFTVDSSTTLEDHSVPLVINFIGFIFYGRVMWTKENISGGEENIIVTLYNSDKTKTDYMTMTNKNGYYSIQNIDSGNYYIGFSNLPNDYVFNASEESLITRTGITKESYFLSDEDPIIEVNADIKFNEGIIGSIGPRGIPGINGRNFPSSIIDISKFEQQIVIRNSPLNLGNVAEGNGSDIYYSKSNNSIVLNSAGVYMVTFTANVSFFNNNTSEDYLALQIKLGNNYIKHAFTYRKDNGILYSSSVIRNYNYNNYIQLINVGTQDIKIDNINITVFKTA